MQNYAQCGAVSTEYRKHSLFKTSGHSTGARSKLVRVPAILLVRVALSCAALTCWNIATDLLAAPSFPIHFHPAIHYHRMFLCGTFYATSRVVT